MKFLLPILTLTLAGSLFSMDEYLPVKEKTIEADIGYMYMSITGIYDEDGKKHDAQGSPAASMIPLQIKYGIIPGLDVEVMVPFTMLNKDLMGESLNGLDQPSIGLKYAVPDIGAGGYLDFSLPMGAEDIVGENPTMAITIGGIYGLVSEKFNFLATVDYTLQFEDKDKYKSGNTLSILAKPEYKPIEQLGIYAGINFDLDGESQWDGDGLDDAGHLLTLQPGINFAANEMIAIEVGAPIILMGKNTFSGWGLLGNVYFTFGL